jgi:ABC-2 type transport system ATP-binding protein
MLTGLAHPTRGRAWIAGIEITSADSAARRTFGYLPQTPAFYTWMTPVEYLAFCGRLFEMTQAAIRQRTTEILALVGLEKASHRRISGFSGGMLQRLGIAQALIHNPPVLFLDEPTSSLDPAGRYEVLDLIHRLSGQVTIFLSSHILADIERVCDQVAIIREGRLVLVAGREELLNRYAQDTAVLTLTPGSPEFPFGFLENLRAQPWVARLQLTDGVLQVTASDLPAARLALLALAADHRLELQRYEWVRPTLEEIFLSLSA